MPISEAALDLIAAIQRVRDRVRNGGHSVPEEDVRRRFDRGLKNLFGEYLQLLDSWTLLDNSGSRPGLIAPGSSTDLQILDEVIFQRIKLDIQEP